ncbi:hypothetical protein [Emticicia sp. 17c]|uniref:hypothetical protein n=1 Tax=Emticicia sp. 17c TaxID=3127704 RepID=UPI00301C272C
MAQSRIEKFQREIFGGMTFKQFLSAKENQKKLRVSLSLSLVMIVYLALLIYLLRKHRLVAFFVLLLAPGVLWAIFIRLAIEFFD